MPNNTPSYNTYQQSAQNTTGYTEVERSTEYEYRSTWYFHGALPIESRWYRKFETVTYEAILTEQLPNEPQQYNNTATIPTEATLPAFPETTAESKALGWKLQSIEYTKSLSTPLSRDCRITFIKQDEWVHITNNNNSGNSGN